MALLLVARQRDEYPQLFALIDADEPEEPGADYLAAARTQARRALADHGPKLRAETREFLRRVSG